MNKHENEFREFVKEKGYSFNEGEKYKNSKEKIELLCSKSHVYGISPKDFKRGVRCRTCVENDKVRKWKEKFISNLHDKGYELIDDKPYTDQSTKMKVKCPNGHEYYTNSNNFNRGRICDKCSKMQRKHHTKTRFLKEVHSEGYDVVGRFVSAKTPVLLRCTVGHDYKTSPDGFFQGNRCRRCSYERVAREMMLTNEEFIKKVTALVNNEYTFKECYKKADIPIKVEHNMCGYEYMVKPNNFLSGKRCPRCNESSGERMITEYFIENKVEFSSQVTFEDCKYKHVLPFDFCVYDNDKVNMLVEYEGEQHFKPIEHFGGKKALMIRQKRDKIKRDYCKDNNIKLLEIPYWEKDNIEKILNEELSQLLT